MNTLSPPHPLIFLLPPPQLVKEKQQQPQTVPYAIGIGTETFMFCISFAVRGEGEPGTCIIGWHPVSSAGDEGGRE